MARCGQRFPYRTRTLFAHQRRQGLEGTIYDAIDNHRFGKVFAVKTEAGLVDGRVQGNIDLNQEEHEYTPTNLTRPNN